jgi:adenylate cyclase
MNSQTLETFKGVMTNIIPQHRGRVVDSTGDNLLAEFASVVDVDVQRCPINIRLGGIC